MTEACRLKPSRATAVLFLNLSNLIQSIEISTAVARRLNRRGLWKVSFLLKTKEKQRW